MKHSPFARRPIAAGIATACLASLLLAGCAPTPTPQPGASQTADPATYPLTIDNCGFDLTVDAAPKRIVTVKSTATELLLALGLGDRIVATAFQDGPVPADLAGRDLPVLAERMPSEEALLNLTPDFVFGGWESVFTPDAAGDRAELASLGVGSYVSPAACKGDGYRPASLGFDDLFGEISEAGALFGATDAAAALIAEQRDQLDAVETDDTGRTALWWSSGTDTPYVGAGSGTPEMVMQKLGLTNIASGIDDSWASFNWESVIDADPDVIVLVDAAWNTAQSKRAYLASNPATASLDAVINERYLVIPFAAGEAGVRTVPATADLAQQLRALQP